MLFDDQHNTTSTATTAESSSSLSVSELWHQLLSESGQLASEPWLVWDRVRPAMVRARQAYSGGAGNHAQQQQQRLDHSFVVIIMRKNS